MPIAWGQQESKSKRPSLLATIRKCAKKLQINLPFLSIFFIPVLSRPSFTFRTPNKGQKIGQLFYHPMVQVPSPGDVHELHSECFCACYLQTLTKVPCAKSGMFWFAWTDQFPWFNHHSIALVLFYNMSLEPSFSIEPFPSYTTSVQLCGVSVCFLHIYEVPSHFYWKWQAGKYSLSQYVSYQGSRTALVSSKEAASISGKC